MLGLSVFPKSFQNWPAICRHFRQPRLLALLLGSAVAIPAQAQDYSGTMTDTTRPIYRNLFGESGLMDMPDARMAKDGTLAFTIGTIKQNERYTLTFQALPWLEGAFRFSAIDVHSYDRSFSLKARLWKETNTLPQISLGIRDILGTGVYRGEYIVASKQIGAFDVTGGVGWGRFADRNSFTNPIGLVMTRFKYRRDIDPYDTGKVNFGDFFRGPMGVFGGVNWQTPIKNLLLQVEYSGDEYELESWHSGWDQVHANVPVNIGFAWKPWSNAQLSGAYMYGNTYGITLSISGNVAEEIPDALRIGPPVLLPAIRTADQQRSAMEGVMAENASLEHAARARGQSRPPNRAGREQEALMQASEVEALNDARHGAVRPDTPQLQLDPATRKKLIDDFNTQHISLRNVALGPSDIWIYYSNGYYWHDKQARERIYRILMSDLPPDVEYFHLILVSFGHPLNEVSVPRSSLERINSQPMVSETEKKLAETENAPPMYHPALDKALEDSYPSFSFSLDPKLAEHVFDPDDPLQFMIYARGEAIARLSQSWTAELVGTGTLWTNYNFDRTAGSELPHVRTDLMKYADDGKYGMSAMDLAYRTRLGENLYALAKVGYLEDMYAGYGGQLLWRPRHSMFTFGADLYHVWKRDFNRQLGLRGYETTTGHVSIYTALPWYGIHFNIHAGRYLAKDWGATFELTRNFESGVQVGAFATFTNVPFSKFGEGSFDKGLILRIPMQWSLPIFSRSSYSLHMSSLTRDGGQRLAGDDSLYEETMP